MSPIDKPAAAKGARAGSSDQRGDCFRRLAQRTSDLIVLVDARGVIDMVSGTSEKLFAIEPPALIDRLLFDLLAEDDIEPARRLINASWQDRRHTGSVECRPRGAGA